MGALRLHRRHSSWRADITAIRAAFGIAPELYKDFAQLRRKVLEKAKAEIDLLAHFTVEWREIKRGRAVAEVEFAFHPKNAPAQFGLAGDVDRQEPRRTLPVGPGVSTNLAASLALPRPLRAGKSAAKSSNAAAYFPSGSLQFAAEPFGSIAREHGGGWDRDVIANAYREQMGGRLANLTGMKLIKSWTGFCQAYAARRGRP
jgi:hypothetical protein